MKLITHISEMVKRNSVGGPQAIGLFGIWTLFVWVSQIAVFDVHLPSFVSKKILHAAMGVSFFSIAIALFLIARKAEIKPRVFESVDRVFAILASVSAGCIFAPGYLAVDYYDDALAIAGTILCGATIAWLYARWASLLAEMNGKLAVISLFGGCLIWPIATFILGLLPKLAAQCALMVIPCVSCLLLHYLSRYLQDGHRHVGHRKEVTVSAWKAWLTIVSVCLVLSFPIEMTKGPVLEEFRIVPSLIKGIMPFACYAGVLWWMLGPNNKTDFPSLWRFVFYALGLSLTLMALFPSFSWVTVFLSSVWMMLVPIVWITVCEIARHSLRNRMVNVSLGLALYCAASALGGFLYSEVFQSTPSYVLCVLLLFLLFIVLGFCLGTRDPGTQCLFEDLRGERSIEEFDTINSRCEEMGAIYGLTSREVEILKMICKGRSRAYMAETLFITENTVKTHVSHIYGKLGVHSKTELQHFIGV